MQYKSFCQLVRLLSPSLMVSVKQGCNRRNQGGVHFSEHYQCHGLNVQAACDAGCRFIYFFIRCPGGTGDSKAFYGTRLATFLAEISTGYYVAADNAYSLSVTLLISYSGNDKRYPAKDVFNFSLSQLRIKIKQAFRMMVNKWHVFKKT
jgi:hypothetical protein